MQKTTHDIPPRAGRLSSGDLPRLATAPSPGSSVGGDSSQHGSLRQDSQHGSVWQDSTTSRLGVNSGRGPQVPEVTSCRTITSKAQGQRDPPWCLQHLLRRCACFSVPRLHAQPTTAAYVDSPDHKDQAAAGLCQYAIADAHAAQQIGKHKAPQSAPC